MPGVSWIGWQGHRAHGRKPKLTTLPEKLVKIGAKVASHGRYFTFQLAEVAISRRLFAAILSLIDELRPRPAPA